MLALVHACWGTIAHEAAHQRMHADAHTDTWCRTTTARIRACMVCCPPLPAAWSLSASTQSCSVSNRNTRSSTTTCTSSGSCCGRSSSRWAGLPAAAGACPGKGVTLGVLCLGALLGQGPGQEPAPMLSRAQPEPTKRPGSQARGAQVLLTKACQPAARQLQLCLEQRRAAPLLLQLACLWLVGRMWGRAGGCMLGVVS